MKVLGKPRRRVDGRAKVTGQTRFADDIMLPRMLHMRCCAARTRTQRSIHRFFKSSFLLRGALVLTGKDFPVSFGILPVSQDEYPLAPEHVRYVGDPVAAVVARTSRPRRGPRPDRRQVSASADHLYPEEALANPNCVFTPTASFGQHPPSCRHSSSATPKKR